MPKFRVRWNREIEAVQFWPDEKLWPPGIVQDTRGAWSVYNELHHTLIKLAPGDWVNITDPGDVYPIQAALFAERYEPVDDG